MPGDGCIEPLLQGLVTTGNFKEIRRKRGSEFDFFSVKKGAEKPYLEEGWLVAKENKGTTRLQMKKPVGRLFEDRLWCVLSKMEFQEMNSTDGFRIPLSESEGVNPKQIDVFAKDEGIALVIECKSSSESSKVSFRKDLLEIGGYREQVTRAIRKHYGQKLRIGWVIATSNIVWSEPDIELARSHNIKLLRDEDIDYYDRLVAHIGASAKYQLFASFFENTQIEDLQIRVPAIRGNVGGHKFYSFALEPARLLPISFIAHRKGSDDDTILTYQRMLNRNRLRSIREYVEKTNGLFPNSIIVNFHTNPGSKNSLRFDVIEKHDLQKTEAVPGILYLPNRYKSAWIIDGQHRLYGFSGTNAAKTATLPVIAFENLDSSTQAKMFVDINSKQKRVRKDLLIDLWGSLFEGSEHESDRLKAIASKIIKDLSTNSESPLRNIVKSPSELGEGRWITITTLADSILKAGLIGRVEEENDKLLPGPFYVLKGNMMEETLERGSKILTGYLNEFRDGVSDNWMRGNEEGGYVCTNNGLAALILVLAQIIKHIGRDLDAIEVRTNELIDEIRRYTKPVVDFLKNASPEQIRELRNRYGPQGQKYSAFDMMWEIHKSFNEFRPQGLEQYISEVSSGLTDKSYQLTKEIQLMISNDVLSSLKTNFGESNDRWWREIPDQVRKDVAVRREEEEENIDREKCFELIHYKRIIEKHWLLFRDVYGFRQLGNEKYGAGKDAQLTWYNELNRIRKKWAHPEKPHITQVEYDFLRDLKTALQGRIGNRGKSQNSQETQDPIADA